MDFGTLMKVAFSDPKPEYEFTRMKFVWIINEYIRGSLQKNLLRPHFGVSGTVEYPPASPVPYLFAPDSGNRCAAISSFVPGNVTEAEYDKVAQSSKKIGTFWGNLFELIGRGTLRSVITFMPLIPDETAPDNFSTPYVYSPAILATNESYYLTIPKLYSTGLVLRDWRKAGDDLFESIRDLQITDPEILRSHVSAKVRETATRTSMLWRHYQGTIKPSGQTPGVLEGYIYGSIKFD